MRRINKGNFAWFIVLLLFTSFLIYLLLSRKIYTFINPEMVKYTIFGLLGFVVLTTFQSKKIFDTHEEDNIKIGYILFLLPLFLGITNRGFNVSIADKKNVTVAERQVSSRNAYKDHNVISTEENNKGNFIKDGKVRFNDKNYYHILNDISRNLDRYVNQKVEIVGFAYKDKGFGKNNFVVARMLMTCCAADSQVVGIMCEYPYTGNIEKGTWVKVQGIINAKDYKSANGKTQYGMAVIEVKKIISVRKPASEYIYP
ncbi:TIGR03943 family putative permease subunit [Clostridium oryzae]|uniref:Putative two-component membrane permease complex subunit n=1 Tax=Clostridium oryzae TaxID=1450648 RepID=A0A1V4IDQ7_9CLOT|nr:TIGR03943 family protein [Clostridium oryzae]OPJ58091.1 putative two-component membrane permease complex subunit [Clostridium oryzae]